MKFPSLKRINKADFDPQYGSLVDKLGSILNYTLELFYNAFNNSISLGDNILCNVKSITLTVDKNGVPTAPSSFQLANSNIISPIQGLSVLQVVNNTTQNALLPGSPFILYSLSQNQSSATSTQPSTITQTSPYIVNINQVTGLIPGNSYTITVVAWG